MCVHKRERENIFLIAIFAYLKLIKNRKTHLKCGYIAHLFLTIKQYNNIILYYVSVYVVLQGYK